MEKHGEEAPFLIAQTGPLNGLRWALQNDLILGRESDCDIVISDRQVSRHHARIQVDNDGILLEDLGSKNGTHHNGVLLTDGIRLQDGDIIQIALAQRFIFLSSDSTIPLDNQQIDFNEFIHSGISPITVPVESGRLRLEKKSRQIWIKMPSNDGLFTEVEILPPLSVFQFRLLEILYDNQSRVVSRQELVDSVWGEGQALDISEQALDALIRRLRDRIGQIDPEHAYIVTIRGHGLRLENPPL